jgi:hypothetical protein
MVKARASPFVAGEIEHGSKSADFLYRGTEKMGEMDFRCDGSICS